MTFLRSTLLAAAVLGGLAAGSAQAAPALPQPGLGTGLNGTIAVRHHRMHRHHSTRAERRARRMNTLRHGDPNARNPERPGYKQQLGNTSGGPRY